MVVLEMVALGMVVLGLVVLGLVQVPIYEPKHTGFDFAEEKSFTKWYH